MYPDFRLNSWDEVWSIACAQHMHDLDQQVLGGICEDLYTFIVL